MDEFTRILSADSVKDLCSLTPEQSKAVLHVVVERFETGDFPACNDLDVVRGVNTLLFVAQSQEA